MAKFLLMNNKIEYNLFLIILTFYYLSQMSNITT